MLPRKLRTDSQVSRAGEVMVLLSGQIAHSVDTKPGENLEGRLQLSIRARLLSRAFLSCCLQKHLAVNITYGGGSEAWDTVYPTGGAGVVFTISAVHALVNAANSGSCKMANTNFDVMLGRCSDAASVERVHVEGMWQQPVAAISDEVLAAPWGVLTVHKFKDRLEVTRAFGLNSPCQ
ncbi:hypothetical protein FOZ62_002429 [Perkinsus olseni]|uniref:Uncharacterized protein n=1 Tax=Perkinsus olseni TaxID=32597 RepID=A0A7J6UAQ0_PEROL|nr:hypothetical protein FOZ62_002429 [Perkinsus olseni]